MELALVTAEWNGRRKDLEKLPVCDAFERIFVQMLPRNFPSLFIEGYDTARKAVLSMNKRVPAAILTDIGWYLNEPLKFFAAEASEDSVRLVGAQHGAGYGSLRLIPNERHERKVSDLYVTWGWAEKEASGVINLPSPRLSTFLGTGLLPERGRNLEILYVPTCDFPYLYRFHSRPVAGQWEKYAEWQLRFFGMLPVPLRAKTRFRYQKGRWQQDEFGKSFFDRIHERFPEVRPDTGQPFDSAMKKSRFVVFDNPGTGFLEALVAEIPTFLFQDPAVWEARDATVPYLDGLCKSGILWDSPEGAAAKLVEVYDDPYAWWNGPRVREARQRYVERYALARSDWPKQWANALKEEALLAGTVARSANRARKTGCGFFL
jgi:putative transferase (TIGR04331 family)